MEWDKVTIQNFLSIEKAEIDLKDQGLILVEGFNKTSNKFKSNGSGKTSIFEAIVYALYDITTKGLKADEVINNKTPKKTNCAVILEGRRGDDHYTIERYRKHTKHKNKVRLICNGQDISEKSTADTNKAIIKLIGMDYQTFTNSILFSQGNGAGRFAVATDKEKKEILENLVNLEIYAKAQDIAKDKVKGQDAKILEKKREIERSNWELAQIDTLEEQDVKNYNQTKSLLIEADIEVKSQEAQLIAYTEGSAEQIEHTKKLIAALENKRDSVTTSDFSAERERVNGLREGLQKLHNDLYNTNYRKDELVKKFKQIQLNTNCPVCGSPLDNTHREQELSSIKDQLREVLMQAKLLQGEIDKGQLVYDEALTDLKTKQDSVSAVNEQYKIIVQAIQKHQKVLTEHDNAIFTLKGRVETAKRTLEGLQRVPEPIDRGQDRITLRDKIKAQKVELLALEKGKTALEDVVKVYSNAGVKSHVLDLITPFLNEHGNTYLNALAGPDMELVFNTQTPNKDGSMSEKFDVKLLNANGGDEYKGNSEGEKKRADLSICLALQDFVKSRSESSMNFEVYDEVFDALDEVGSENVISLLKERKKTVGTIFVVTHNEHLKPLFEKKITVVKGKNGMSTIHEGEEAS